MYKGFLKRFLDLVLSIFVLVIFSPVFFALVIVLLITNKGDVFFLQPRPGKDCRIFKVLKFKTMTNDRDSSGKLLPDVERLTKVGKFIRSTSLDEMPQLINVVKGDMSLIGPRPLLVAYLNLYNSEQLRRHEVRPGITGWAQVNGRNTLDWNKRFEYDVWYVNNMSFWLDCKIGLLTVRKVFKREGISSGTSVTMEPFKGNH